MSQKAYVLITTEKGQGKIVTAELTHLHGVLAAEQVFGRCDVMAVIEADDMHKLVFVVRSGIAMVDHVIHTETLIVSP